MSLGVSSPCQILQVWEGPALIYLNVWYNSPVKSPGPYFCLLGGFWLLFQSSYLWLVFRFSVSSGSVLLCCMFLGVYPFSRLPNLLAYRYWRCTSVILVSMSSLSCLILFDSLFFLVTLNTFVNFVDFFSDPALSIFYLSYGFSGPYFIYFCSLFPSFYYLWVKILIFSISLSC